MNEQITVSYLPRLLIVGADLRHSDWLDAMHYTQDTTGLRTGAKLAEIGRNFIETQRKEHTRLQVSLFQFISRYSTEFRVLFYTSSFYSF